MYEIDKLETVFIGYQGENETRTIAIDVSSWIKEFPQGNIAILHSRPTEKNPYIVANATVNNGVLEWVVNNADVGISGMGYAIVQMSYNEQVLKTAIFTTKIGKTLDGTISPTPTPPAPSWVTDILNSRAEQFEIDDNGHLIVTKVDGTTEDLGQVVGGGSGAVSSVNGKIGDVVLDASDVGALPDDTPIPTRTSDLTNDSGFISDDDTLAVGSVEVDVNSIKPYDYEQIFTIPNDITSGSTVQIEFANTLREFALEITTPEVVIPAMTGYFYLSTLITSGNMNNVGRFWEPALGQSHASKLCVSFTKGRDGIYRLNGYKYGLTSDTDYSAGITYNSFARQNNGRLYFDNPQPMVGIWFNVGGSGDISQLAGTTIKVRGLKW